MVALFDDAYCQTLINKGDISDIKTHFNTLAPLHKEIFLNTFFDNPRSSMPRAVPLHWAIEQGAIDLVAIFIEAGACLTVENTRDDILDTPLTSAVFFSNPDIITRLLAAGADPRLKTTEMNTPLHRLFDMETEIDEDEQKNKIHILDLLLEQGADINSKDEMGDTPLHNLCLECTRNVPPLLEALLERGVDVNIANNDGATPLFRLLKHCASFVSGSDKDLLDWVAVTQIISKLLEESTLEEAELSEIDETFDDFPEPAKLTLKQVIDEKRNSWLVFRI